MKLKSANNYIYFARPEIGVVRDRLKSLVEQQGFECILFNILHSKNKNQTQEVDKVTSLFNNIRNLKIYKNLIDISNPQIIV